jgi:Mn2+/Fe2+ NRAMP family transporter
MVRGGKRLMRQLIFAGIVVMVLSFVFIIVFTYFTPVVIEVNDTIHDLADVNDTDTRDLTDKTIERWNAWPVVAMIALLGTFAFWSFMYVRNSY